MLRAGGHGATISSSSIAAPGRLRRPLIIAEVALSLVVLVATGLLVRSYDRITKASPGFVADGVVSFRVSLPGLRYKTPESVLGFYDDLSRRLKALPGVRSVGSNYQLPLSSVALAWEPIIVDGYVPKAPGDARIITSSAYVSPDYFATMGISLVRGRDFTPDDKRGTPDVVIVDDKFAARFWPGEDAIGKRIRQSVDAPWRTVVGIVSNTRAYQADAQPPITTYFPVEQFTIGSRFVVVRVANALNPRSVLQSASREIRAIDPELPTYDVSTMDQRVTDSLARRRLSMLILTVFGVIALVLSAIGIYGIIAFWVGQRRREIGIRVALGAGRERILAMIGREVIVSVAAGLIVGLGVAFAATRLMTGLLFGIHATDAVTYVATPVALIAVAIAAAFVPARRAIAIQPAVTLREE
jgi:predicted permease